MNKSIVWMVLFVLLGVGIALAQDTACPDIVQTVLSLVDEACTEIGRNQACYGHNHLEAVARDAAAGLNFGQPGDRADVSSLEALTVGAMDQTGGDWGVALLRVQANLPDTLPGQNVTVILFGDVSLTGDPEASAPVAVSISAANNVNVRGGPSTTAAIAATMPGGKSVTADGRLEDGSWLHVRLADGVSGWVSASVVRVEGDAAGLPVMTAEDTAPPASSSFGGGAFYFRSDIGEATCSEALNGIVLQSPPGAQSVSLTINGASVTIGSTVVLQGVLTDSGPALTLSTLSGVAQVTVGGVSQIGVQGTALTLPLDSSGTVQTVEEPVPLDEAGLTPLVKIVDETRNLIVPLPDDESDLLTPLVDEGLLTPLTRDDPVVALPADRIEEVTRRVAQALLERASHITNGLWQRSFGSTTVTGTCLNMAFGDGGDGSGGGISLLPVCQTPDAQALIVDGAPYFVETPGIYADQYTIADVLMQHNVSVGVLNTTTRWELRVVSPTRIEETYTNAEEGGCTVRSTIAYELVQSDEAVCADALSSPPTPIPPEELSIERIPGGDYTASVTLPGGCNASNSPPDLSRLTLSFDPDGNLLVNPGTDNLIAYNLGGGVYEYQEIGATSMLLLVSGGPGGLYLNWSKSGGGETCIVSTELTPSGGWGEGVSTPVAPSASSSDEIAAGTYSAEWFAVGDCPADAVASITQYEQATLSFATDGSLVVDYGTGTLTLELQSGSYLSIMDSGSSVIAYTAAPDGQVSAAYITNTCSLMGVLSPQN